MPRLLICLSLVCLPHSLFAQEQDSGGKLVAARIAILELNGDLQLKDGADVSAADLNQLIAKLREQKALEHYQFFNLAALENQPAMVQVGRTQPVVSGQNIIGRGGAPRISNVYQQQDTGSLVEITSRVRDDDKIIVELSVESSRLVDIAPSESDDDDATDFAARFSPPMTKTLSCRTTVLVQSDVGTVIAAGGEDNAAEASRTYIVVSATAK